MYITLPTDLTGTVVSATQLRTPLHLAIPENDAATEAVVSDEIMKQVSAARERVAVIVDGCALRYGITNEMKDLLGKKTKFPVFVAPMGKSAVDESYERYGGVSIASVYLRAPLTLPCADLHRMAQFAFRQTNNQTGRIDNLHRCDLQ